MTISPSPKDGKMDGGWTPNARQLSWLKLYKPETYGIALPDDGDRRSLYAHGYIDWMPPVLGSMQWVITDKGRAAIHRARSTGGGGE